MGKNTDAYIKQIWWPELEERDLILLQQAAKLDYYRGDTGESLINAAAQLQIQVWRVVAGDKLCIIVTKILQRKGGKEFIINYVKGSGYIKNLDMIYERLEEFAKAEGCSWFSCEVTRKGFDRIYEKFKPSHEYKTLIKEL